VSDREHGEIFLVQGDRRIQPIGALGSSGWRLTDEAKGHGGDEEARVHLRDSPG
jgi:hypothetical protein